MFGFELQIIEILHECVNRLPIYLAFALLIDSRKFIRVVSESRAEGFSV